MANELLKKITPSELKGLIILAWELTKDNPNVHPMAQAAVESIGIRTGVLQFAVEQMQNAITPHKITPINPNNNPSGVPSINGEPFSAVLADMGPDGTGHVSPESIQYDKDHGIGHGLDRLAEREKQERINKLLEKNNNKLKSLQGKDEPKSS